MRESPRLTIAEFLSDLLLVVRRPGSRFAVIKERGAIWGSLLVLLLPAYVGLSWVGSVYVDRDPFPGYGWLMPLGIGAALSGLKILLLHIPARVIQGRGSYRKGQGRFMELVCVFGYTTIPDLLATLVGLVLFLSLPSEVGRLYRDHRILTISGLVAIGIALFVWNLILTVLAMRVVYPMRDWKIVAALAIGTAVILTVMIPSTRWAVDEVGVNVSTLRPILTDRILRYYVAGPADEESPEPKVSIHADRLAYRFGAPRRGELLIFEATPGYTQTGAAPRPDSAAERKGRKRVRLVGRVLGLPGDTVELRDGTVIVDGREIVEPYLLDSMRAAADLPSRRLGPAEYFVLPEDRNLVSAHTAEWVVPRERISGRMLLEKWPLGWMVVQEHIFRSKPAPSE